MRQPTVRCGFGPCVLRGLALLWLALLLAVPVRAQGLEVLQLYTSRDEQGNALLDFHVDPTLPRGAEDALRRGIPLYFVAQATVYKPRWYWRDERVARATRSWRLSFQPLTSSWRVGQGALQQSFPTQSEALAVISRASRWRIADEERLNPAERGYYVEFSYRLDTSQLPRPMQIGIGNETDWALGYEQTLRLE